MRRKPRIRSLRLSTQDASQFDEIASQLGIKKQFLLEGLIKALITFNDVISRKEARIGYRYPREEQGIKSKEPELAEEEQRVDQDGIE